MPVQQQVGVLVAVIDSDMLLLLQPCFKLPYSLWRQQPLLPLLQLHSLSCPAAW
jgi:hypothetical protein